MEELYRQVNHHMAVMIANKAKESNVGQFIFMSTAAVYGDKATYITKDTKPKPTTYYGASKLAAEEEIIKLRTNDFKVAIIRPPMVYGEGCKGNYARLHEMVKFTKFFPIIYNKRSVITIDNLILNLMSVIEKEMEGYYHPQDLFYVSTSDLVVMIRKKLGKKTILIDGFSPLLKFGAKLSRTLSKLCEDFYYEQNL